MASTPHTSKNSGGFENLPEEPLAPKPKKLDNKDEHIVRQCVSCRVIHPRRQLLRVVHNRSENDFYVVPPLEFVPSHFPEREKEKEPQVVQGRSVYICFNEECLKKALKGKKTEKALKTAIPDDILKCLHEMLKGISASGHRQS